MTTNDAADRLLDHFDGDPVLTPMLEQALAAAKEQGAIEEAAVQAGLAAAERRATVERIRAAIEGQEGTRYAIRPKGVLRAILDAEAEKP